MDIISFPNNNFNFDQLTLGLPSGLQGGSYFTKLYNNDDKVYLQSPSCSTKQGIVKTGKKVYIDLMFTPDNQNILNWFETLQEKVQTMIYEKRNTWFHNEMDIEDIESAFISPVRTFKSGKFYLIRANININNFNIYDEDENPINIEVLNDTNNKIIPLIEILGVKFTSRSFQFEISLKQIMVIQERNILNNCLIKRANTTMPIKDTNVIHEQTSEEDNEQEDIKQENNKEVVQIQKNTDDVDDIIIENENIDNENKLMKEEDSDSLEKYESTEVNKDESQMNEGLENSQKSLLNHEDNTDLNETNSVNEDENNNNDLDNSYNLEEVDIDYNSDDQSINLKQPNEVYYEIWKEARKKAKNARKAAIEAYLEAKNIKTTYMLDEINESDDEFDEYIESLRESEKIENEAGSLA